MIQEKLNNNAIIFTHEVGLALKVRNRFIDRGICIEYAESISDLIDFIFFHEVGIVLIDSNSYRLQSYVQRYSLRQLLGNISFVFLNDYSEVKVDCDNTYTFISNYDRLESTIDLLNEKAIARRSCLNAIPQSVINAEACKILKSFNFPRAYKGYEYIKDCVNIMLDEEDGCDYTLKEIYGMVAREHGKTGASVEKCIRTIITETSTKHPEKFIEKLNSAKISNLAFLSYMVETIRREYAEQLSSK